MVKRTSDFWNKLSKQERKRLHALECAEKGCYSGGGYLPDDCSECGGCGNPVMGIGLCHNCYLEYKKLINKASCAEDVEVK